MSAIQPRSFMWYELMTPDPVAAVAFYRRVIGWETKDSGVPGAGYTVLSVGERGVGGVMALTPEMTAGGARPCWLGYVGVDDVDGYAARVTAAGGKVLRGPADIPGTLRFAVVADPYGAVFMLLRGMVDQELAPLAPGTPGGIGWHELHAGDRAGAFEFYSQVFGWTKAEAVDMGPMGVYQTFATGGYPVGGMMTRMPESPGTFWLYYFNVDGIDAAVAGTVEAGGKLIMGPHQVPAGSWIANCMDPQGVIFAMVSLTR
jgi:predicted enzyme related to lactoylglutathione lyase